MLRQYENSIDDKRQFTALVKDNKSSSGKSYGDLFVYEYRIILQG